MGHQWPVSPGKTHNIEILLVYNLPKIRNTTDLAAVCKKSKLSICRTCDSIHSLHKKALRNSFVPDHFAFHLWMCIF
jgi:hypothetical protein